jgi:Trypsin
MKNQKRVLRTSRVGILGTVAGATLLLGACAVEPGGPELTLDDDTRSQDQELIGGAPVGASFFRSTVGIGGECTAAKVGSRLFLTAAHCVDVRRPGRFEEVPPNFPPNQGVDEKYLAGKPLRIDWGLSTAGTENATFTIVKTTIHPSWWACPLCQDPTLSDGAADVAVIEIAQDTPQIPMARVDLTPVPQGTPVVKVGFGCEERTNLESPPSLGRYKAASATTLAPSALAHESFGPPLTESQISQIGAGYLITAGYAQGSSFSSLCLGDSGGPLYLSSSSDPRVVGVNSNYSFKPSSDPNDLGGVSWTDWHTKTSLDSLHGVGNWLRGLNVNTVGGQSNANCTCARGCNAVKTVNAPLTKQGVDDSCYFFPNLGYSLNNHSMIQMTLNGQNITNRWVGNWAYPARRDGGYYVYVRGSLGWSWWQATN